ncbi:DUF2158 domain-containing protein [uncultured Roseibium sp.]|uniref:YodC family protein n=1 Tax=uncultured Roseibium sp. TaxID=1936171 RepID=UPI00261CC311|nr:DUF2158 domain-containing protein [uncultured Roseibium sp.]
MKTTLVYGPMASGKTLNRELIAEYLGCDGISDDGLVVRFGSHRTLILSNTPAQPACAYDDLLEISKVKKFILNHPGYADRWKEPDPDFGRVTKLIDDTEAVLAAVRVAEGNISDGADVEHTIPDAPIDVVAKAEWRPKVGDVVKLQSCPKGMTVLLVEADQTVECAWFEGSAFQTCIFPKTCLTRKPQSSRLPYQGAAHDSEA